MATRRTKRKQTRKGGNPFTRYIRRATGTNIFGSSTSLLANEIYAMLDKNGIKYYRKGDFDNLIRHHPHVKKRKLLRDLRTLGMNYNQESDVLYHLEEIIPSRIEQYETTTI